MTLAACAGKPAAPTERAAIQVCLGCPIRPECLNRAIAQLDISRPRGGLSTSELRRVMGGN